MSVDKIEDTAVRSKTDIGHYFDQTVFDNHLALTKARAEQAALGAELAALGIVVDPVTGAVTIAPRSPN